MNDFSFIRLEPDFATARDTRLPSIADVSLYDYIQLLPDEHYVQITNVPDGISFSDNVQVLIVDCKDRQLADVTPRVMIKEFTDNRGKQQIVYEMYKLGVDFYKYPVFFKFIHTVSDHVWWSNPVIISNYEKQFTQRFVYKSYHEHAGIAYNIANLYQSIRLRCYFDGNDGTSSAKEYVTIDGIAMTSRLIDTEWEKYKFERINDFTYRRLNKMLSSDVIYSGGYRITNKNIIPSNERSGNSNFYPLDFKLAVDYSEFFDEGLQMFSVFHVTAHWPLAIVPIRVSHWIQIWITFNNFFHIGTGAVTVHNSLGLLVASYPTGLITGDKITFFPLGFTPAPGVYTITLPLGFALENTTGDTTSISWEVTVIADVVHEYDPADYDTDNDYL